ncbi:hypothetical protein ACFPER_14070 [Agromyces aurantiacus]|uniref:DUF4190 domain-containing protein n=1 Tax=Agromyces aurantiacus TaxID=165814 RepID=A0ABV9R7Z6_9MICO|nr:hypothetical protein [Agromyces aurantiacus]MBM7505179.1 hypothetical protein [Agromyces aurantiacus]
MTHDQPRSARTRPEWPAPAKAWALVIAGVSMLTWASGIWFTVPVSLAALALAEIAGPELGRARVWLMLLAITGVVLGIGRVLASM